MHHRSTNGSFNSGSGGKTTRDEEELDKLLLGKCAVQSLFSDFEFSDIKFNDTPRFGHYFERFNLLHQSNTSSDIMRFSNFFVCVEQKCH